MSDSPAKVQIVKSLPLHIQVYESLRSRILHGEFPAGSRIQEQQISKEYCVSRSPVREAIRMLHNDELLMDSDRGLIVTPLKKADAIEIYECRIVMEPFAAGLASQNIDDETLLYLDELLHRVESLQAEHASEHFSEIIELNSEFHSIIIENAQHKRIQSYIARNNALSALLRANEFYQLGGRSEEFVEQHYRILDALKKHDRELAEECMKTHILTDLAFFKKHAKLTSDDDESF